MTQLGTPAAPSLTSYEDAFAIKDMVERAFGSHVDAYKKCMSLRLETPGEIKTRDGLKRQLDLLRLECLLWVIHGLKLAAMVNGKVA